ncbi:MAG: class I SAM-dependent methyltransferase [Chloroflexota bacterium]|nr:class I SAM-dependent methyltransferase [Chloroflexota bacterium]MBI5702365.1 class I SAM-dependent methyltransferase [Chloroflexota bacterium]
MAENTKQQVREFYDQIGWSQVGDGLYQNARYEDLRPVSREYIHKCHMRVKRHLAPSGEILLDAGSGPVQWPEYLTYSEDYKYRLCADISITALKEARARLGEKGLFVVADIANLPFKPNAFDGVVSMHAIHHLPLSEHKRAYLELVRVLKPGKSGVVVNGWHNPLLMRLVEPFIALGRLLSGRSAKKKKKDWSAAEEQAGTFVEKMTPRWLKDELNGVVKIEIYPWRSLSPRFMRWFVRPRLGGKLFLRVIFWLEETLPRFFGENGQYPLIVIKK